MNIPKMTDEQMRTAFESSNSGRDLSKTAAGDYTSPWVVGDWEVWCEAWAARDAQWQAALAEQEPDGDAVAQVFSAITGAITIKPGAGLKDGDLLYTHPAPSTPAAQERANRDADEFSRYTPKEWVSQERAEPVAPAVGGIREEAISVIARLLMLYEHRSEIDSYKAAEALLSATPPAPAQPLATSDPEGHRQAIADHEAATHPSPEPSKPEQAEAPTASNAEPVARIEFRRGEAGRENEMPRVISCNWLPDGVYEVYLATLPPASAAGERDDLSQWEQARFGYFDQAGRFVEFSGEDNELPNDSSPRWVGGRHDMQLLRAALSTKPQAEQEATPPAQTVQDKKGGV